MENTKLKSRMSSKVKVLDKEVKETSVALNPARGEFLAFSENTLDLLQTNLKHQQLTLDLFDVVKSPAGGSTVFSVPTINGEEPAKELTGIILDFTTPRAYWDTADPVEGTPPTCSSQNGIISTDGKPCLRCPFNDFGSRDGNSNAKACKESVLLFLLRPDNIIPLLVRVPVSSKARFLRYSTRLLSSLTPINSVVTSITLTKTVNKAGQPYSLFDFNAVRKLSPEETLQAQNYTHQFMELVSASHLMPEMTEAS